MHKTSAWPLALAYTALIVYASLYPFADWRNQGIEPWAFLTAPWPRYWTLFDVVSNVLGYMPQGFLLALSALRMGRARAAVGLATLACGLLSLTMESLQSYLPVRVASNLDLLLNLLGGALGAASAGALEQMGAIDHWSRFRDRWFVADARWALVLLALWPLALLFPASVPFGLGQVRERAEPVLMALLAALPGLQAWDQSRNGLQAMQPATEGLCVLLGVLSPCLLGYCVIDSQRRRALFLLVALGAGCAMTALSAALSFGPVHAWAWLSPSVQVGGVLALLLLLLLLPLPAAYCAAGLLPVLVLQLSLLNQAPIGSYFTQTLQTWERGRFIRFHGLAQWLGWLWPFAALLYVLGRVGSSATKTKIGA
jgi:VanZ family protein